MRSCWRLLIATVVVAVVCSAPTARAGEPTSINVSEIRPTQAELGRAVVHDIVDTWKADARARNMSLKRYVQTVLRPARAASNVAVILDPQGHVRTFDGHHTIAALQQIQTDSGVALDVKIHIAKDYRGYSAHDYATDLIATGRMRGASASLSRSPEAQLATIPSRFSGMRDAPLRTIVGRIFKRSGISGRQMTNYIEFQVADRLLAGGLLGQLKGAGLVPRSARELPAAAASDPRIEGAVAARVLGNPAMVSFLLRSARDPSFAGAVKSRVLKAVRSQRARSKAPVNTAGRRGAPRLTAPPVQGRRGAPRLTSATLVQRMRAAHTRGDRARSSRARQARPLRASPRARRMRARPGARTGPRTARPRR